MILKTKNIILRVFLIIMVCVSFIPVNESKADYEDFLNKLKSIDIPVDELVKDKGLPRYELTRLLNTVECKDCIIPSQTFVDKYNLAFWSDFKLIAGNNFNDIGYLGGILNNENYYYCVAYAGDNEYMNGYPSTSPVCDGEFCGVQSVNKAEFIQVIINLIGNYIYQDINTDRKSMKSWLYGLDKTRYQYKTFDIEDIRTIESNADKCDKKCILNNGSEVKTYLKYCMFNLSECGMEPIGKIGEGYWPVAELNLLKNQNIIQIDKDYRNEIGGNMDVEKIFEVIYNVNEKVDCEFNLDYDCDGISNSKDFCPRIYDPSQNDYDKDGIGDECDDDIDNDGVKNPIGIVDESGKINIRLRSQSMDNCLFAKNPDQQDSDKNGIGDMCDSNKDYLSMYISVNSFTGTNAPLDVSFEAITNGKYKDISWKFSDGYTSEGNTVKHTFLKAGIYNISATAKGENNDAYASTTLIVGNNPDDINGVGINTQKLGGGSPFETVLSVKYIGKYDWISRNFGNKEIVEDQDRSFKKLFTEEGTQTITIKAIKDGIIRGVSQFNIGVGEKYPGSILKVGALDSEIGEKITANTEFANFSTRDVSYVERNWGDGKNDKTSSMTNNHTYNVAGQKVIIQKITLKNGKTMTNMITIFVVDKSKFKSNAIMILPSNLDNQIGGKIGFDIKVIGSKLDNYINLIFKYIPSISEIVSGYRAKNYFDYTLVNKGIHVPFAKININQCNYLKSDMTMYVNGNDFCLAEKLNGDLKKYKCDMDKDSIPDICDDDIDGDGVRNLLGILNYENSDCNIPRTDFDNEKYLNQINVDVLNTHFEGICSIDNAPFDKNPNQEDLNLDGIGDIVNAGINGNESKITMFAGDSDGDGILNYKDTCVEIQETYNGINDDDGCPEAGSDSACSDTSLCGNGAVNQGETCDNCPIDIGICKNGDEGGNKGGGGNTNGTGNIGTGNKMVCGNGLVQAGETCDNCPIDIGICKNGDEGGNKGGGGNTNGTGNIGTGNKIVCGNGLVQAGETCDNCPIDIGICKNGDEGGEDISCGNGMIEQGETCTSCPADVGTCEESIKITTEECLQCPCPYSASAASIQNGNTIRATLRSLKRIIPYVNSTSWIVDF